MLNFFKFMTLFNFSLPFIQVSASLPNDIEIIFPINLFRNYYWPIFAVQTSRGRAAVARRAHKVV